jgi:hypothetical protein
VEEEPAPDAKLHPLKVSARSTSKKPDSDSRNGSTSDSASVYATNATESTFQKNSAAEAIKKSTESNASNGCVSIKKKSMQPEMTESNEVSVLLGRLMARQLQVRPTVNGA